MEKGRGGLGRKRSVQPLAERRRSSISRDESTNGAEGEPHGQLSNRTVLAGKNRSLENLAKSSTTFQGSTVQEEDKASDDKNGNGRVDINETSSVPDIDLEAEAAALSSWQNRLRSISASLHQMFPPERSLCCLTAESRIRQACAAALAFPESWPESRRFFDNIILVCIITSSVALAFENPRIGSTRSLQFSTTLKKILSI